MVIKDKIEEFLQSQADRKVFYEHEVKGILRELGMAVPKGIFIRSGKSIPADSGLSFPLVAKVVSSRITAKSDIGGVRLGIGNGDELRSAVAELSRLEDSEGVLVEEMAPPGFEVIVGGTVDATFGPIIMFGLGGLFVELFRDVAFALAPVDRGQAMWLMGETKGEKILKGYRGKPPLDENAVAGIIVTVSEVIATGLVRAIDLNPVALYPSGAMVLDAKMSRL
ncbi:MAG TPA: acetate--CoA ligase family protein [Geobacteraceae bacterium]|nr:acetate--CoA ligase family protein [Geobacteraceae bacterium]